jgi:hypothetical protein
MTVPDVTDCCEGRSCMRCVAEADAAEELRDEAEDPMEILRPHCIRGWTSPCPYHGPDGAVMHPECLVAALRTEEL